MWHVVRGRGLVVVYGKGLGDIKGQTKTHLEILVDRNSTKQYEKASPQKAIRVAEMT
jgi:hypothetical protein